MMTYLDKAFCTHISCKNNMCTRNQNNIDTKHYEEVGLPLSMVDFTSSCMWLSLQGGGEEKEEREKKEEKRGERGGKRV